MLTGMMSTITPLSEPGLRMNGKYSSPGGLLLDFGGDAVTLDCGPAHVKQPYTVENSPTQSPHPRQQQRQPLHPRRRPRQHPPRLRHHHRQRPPRLRHERRKRHLHPAAPNNATSPPSPPHPPTPPPRSPPTPPPLLRPPSRAWPTPSASTPPSSNPITAAATRRQHSRTRLTRCHKHTRAVLRTSSRHARPHRCRLSLRHQPHGRPVHLHHARTHGRSPPQARRPRPTQLHPRQSHADARHLLPHHGLPPRHDRPRPYYVTTAKLDSAGKATLSATAATGPYFLFAIVRTPDGVL